MAQNRTFSEWLKANGHTIDSFARSIRVPYNTVLKWTQKPGINPRYYMAERVYTFYPNCPLIAGFKPITADIEIDSPMVKAQRKPKALPEPDETSQESAAANQEAEQFNKASKAEAQFSTGGEDTPEIE